MRKIEKTNILKRYNNCKTSHQRFFRWLKNHNCYKQFLNSCNLPHDRLMRTIENQGSKSIDYCLTWCETKEGYSWWSNLHYWLSSELNF